jgi:hypothetical protein
VKDVVGLEFGWASFLAVILFDRYLLFYNIVKYGEYQFTLILVTEQIENIASMH